MCGFCSFVGESFGSKHPIRTFTIIGNIQKFLENFRIPGNIWEHSKTPGVYVWEKIFFGSREAWKILRDKNNDYFCQTLHNFITTDLTSLPGDLEWTHPHAPPSERVTVHRKRTVQPPEVVGAERIRLYFGKTCVWPASWMWRFSAAYSSLNGYIHNYEICLVFCF